MLFNDIIMDRSISAQEHIYITLILIFNVKCNDISGTFMTPETRFKERAAICEVGQSHENIRLWPYHFLSNFFPLILIHETRPVVTTIFTHVVHTSVCLYVCTSPLFKIDQNKTDLHCRPGLWTGRVDHWWPLSYTFFRSCSVWVTSGCAKISDFFLHHFFFSHIFGNGFSRFGS